MNGTRGGPWAQAAALAARTPEARNRYVDFLRAASILVVVFGHWLMAAPYVVDGSPRISHMLDVAPWSQWLTWLLQVMPVFFFVGGYANGTSWASARRKGSSYAAWLSSRMQRLLGPVLPLLFVWAAMAAVAHQQGVHPEMIRIGSKVALVPTWFLAVYVLVVVCVPLSHAAWRRFGYASVAALGAAAVAVDLAFFAGAELLAWVNYLFVWLAVHQLGYAWRDGTLRGPARGLLLAAGGLAALGALTELGPYPRSLVGVPGEAVSNTQPPKVPLLALGALQIGLLLAVESPARRVLARAVPWTATVLVNGMIMTIFLWHSTVMMLLIGLAFWSGGIGLAPAPNSAAWWALRPAWLAVFAVVTAPVVLLFARFERAPSGPPARPVRAWRLLAGGVLICAGLAMLAMDGIAGSGSLGIRVFPLLLPLAGTWLAGFGPLPRLR